MNIGTFIFDRDVILAATALLVSLALLWAYLRAVKRSMLRSIVPSGDAGTASVHSPNVTTAPPELPLEIVQPETPSNTAVRSVWRGPGRTAAIQVVAGFIYAAGVTLAWTWLAARTAGWQGFVWEGFVMFTLFFAWPLVVVIGLVLTVSWRAMGLVVLFYAALIVPIALYLMQGTGVTPAQFALNWWNINGPATLFVLVFLARPIRAMGPIVAALVVAAAAGVFGMAFFLDHTMIEWVAGVAGDLGFSGELGGFAVGFIVFGSAALAAALVAYIVLRWLGRLYRKQWISDQSIQIDAVWLTFAVLQAPKPLPYAGLAAFLLYKLVASLGQRLVGTRHTDDGRAPRLLLLRVFSLGARSGRLFDAFARVWRYIGTVRLIAGPDLANSTVEPHEFLDFLAGRLQRRFISGRSALDQRLADTQLRRDPDGRLRVSSFYCYADTWQMVLRRLSRESDVVMMDLRGFARANQGCVYELHELLDAVALKNFLLVVDATTDEGFLTEVLRQGWAQIGADSPNRFDPAPRVRLYRLEVAGVQEIGRLVAILNGLRGPGSMPAAA